MKPQSSYYIHGLKQQDATNKKNIWILLKINKSFKNYFYQINDSIKGTVISRGSLFKPLNLCLRKNYFYQINDSIKGTVGLISRGSLFKPLNLCLRKIYRHLLVFLTNSVRVAWGFIQQRLGRKLAELVIFTVRKLRQRFKDYPLIIGHSILFSWRVAQNSYSL